MVDPRVVEPGTAPTPFTADEIRANCPPGRVIRVRVETDQGVVERTNRYVACDDDGAEIERTLVTETGEPAVPAATERSSWLDLQRHASFPADRTQVRQVSLETTLGLADCLLYSVEDGGERSRYWFDKGRAGMPVRFEREVDGTIVTVVTMESDTVEPVGPAGLP